MIDSFKLILKYHIQERYYSLNRYFDCLNA